MSRGTAVFVLFVFILLCFYLTRGSMHLAGQ